MRVEAHLASARHWCEHRVADVLAADVVDARRERQVVAREDREEAGGDRVHRRDVQRHDTDTVRGHAAGAGDLHAQHIAETKRDNPPHPNLFARWAATLCTSGTAIPIPAGEEGLDWEGELAVVIGARASNVAEEDALSHVLGYANFNDVTARTFQRRPAGPPARRDGCAHRLTRCSRISRRYVRATSGCRERVASPPASPAREQPGSCGLRRRGPPAATVAPA